MLRLAAISLPKGSPEAGAAPPGALDRKTSGCSGLTDDHRMTVPPMDRGTVRNRTQGPREMRLHVEITLGWMELL